MVGGDARIAPHQKIATLREMTPEDEKWLEALHEHNSYHDKQHSFLYDLSDEAHTAAKRRAPPKSTKARTAGRSTASHRVQPTSS